MRKVIVIGCPGGGKSTFSRKLHDLTDLPLYHLDRMYWNSDRTKVEKTVFRERLAEVIGKDAWIIDGNYSSTMEWRMEASDTVFFLDYPTEVCLEGIKARKGKPRFDMSWVETGDDEEFLQFIRDYREESRPKVLNLLEKYPDKTVFIFRTRDEAEKFLKNLK